MNKALMRDFSAVLRQETDIIKVENGDEIIDCLIDYRVLYGDMHVQEPKSFISDMAPTAG